MRLRPHSTLSLLRSCLLALTFATAMCSQGASLSLQSGSVYTGSTVQLSLSFGGGSAAGLQWTLAYSSADFTSVAVTAGPIATSAGKSIKCSGMSGSHTCLLTGIDRKEMSEGVVAIATLTAAHAGTSTPDSRVSAVAVNNSAAVSLEGEHIPTTSTATSVTIQKISPTQVVPSTASLGASQTQQFTADSDATWSLDRAIGTITSSGLYTAPSLISSAERIVVKATSRANPAFYATATIYLNPITVSISPVSTILSPSRTSQFVAAVTDATVKTVTWSVAPIIGSISSTGLYTAPSSINSTQTVIVKATSVADPTKYATATVTLSSGDGGGLLTNGLVVRLESDLGLSLKTGSTVGGWLDQSGLGNHLVASGNPQLVNSATPAGLSAIRVDGSGDKLERIHATSPLAGLPIGNSNRTMFLVTKYDASGAWGGLAYGTGATNQAFGLVVKNPSGELALQGWGTENDLVSTAAGNGAGWLVQSAVLANGTGTLFKDGVQIRQWTHTYNTVLTKLVIGAEIKDLGYLTMDVGAVLIYNRALDATERASVEAYLKSKYIQPSQTSTTNGLVAYWPFEEGSGTTTADASGSGKTGTTSGATWVSSGRSGKALNFDGTKSYVGVGKFDIPGNVLTISAWFKADQYSSTEQPRIISKATGIDEQQHYFMLSTINSGGEKLRLRLRTNGSTRTLIATSGNLPTAQWVHAVATYDGAAVRLYKDGLLVGSMAMSGSIDTNSTVPVWIGRNPDGTNEFDGVIDQVRLYNRALTAQEIQQLYGTGQ